MLSGADLPYLVQNLEGKIAKVQISQCTFENNKAGNYGGGVHLSGGNSLGIIAYVSTTEFRSNTANVAGGGLFSSRLERLEIDNVVFHSNKCNRDGGGIFSVVSSYLCRNTVITFEFIAFTAHFKSYHGTLHASTTGMLPPHKPFNIPPLHYF